MLAWFSPAADPSRWTARRSDEVPMTAPTMVGSARKAKWPWPSRTRIWSFEMAAAARCVVSLPAETFASDD